MAGKPSLSEGVSHLEQRGEGAVSEAESQVQVGTFCPNSLLENDWGNLKVFRSVSLDLQIFRFAELFVM